MEKLVLQENERLDDLQIPLPGGRSLSIIQNPAFFCFGTDAVLLARFVRVREGERVCDLGCGCGIIPLMLSAITGAGHITGVEIQREVAKMAVRSVAYNQMEEKVEIVTGDLKEFYGPSAFDVVTCNPPYKERGGGLQSPNPYHAVARNEICCTAADVIAKAANLLRVGGRLAMIHRPERLTELLLLMRENKLEPKRMRMIHPSPVKPPVLVLIEAVRGANPKLLVEAPLIYPPQGAYGEQRFP